MVSPWILVNIGPKWLVPNRLYVSYMTVQGAILGYNSLWKRIKPPKSISLKHFLYIYWIASCAFLKSSVENTSLCLYYASSQVFVKLDAAVILHCLKSGSMQQPCSFKITFQNVLFGLLFEVKLVATGTTVGDEGRILFL